MLDDGNEFLAVVLEIKKLVRKFLVDFNPPKIGCMCIFRHRELHDDILTYVSFEVKVIVKNLLPFWWRKDFELSNIGGIAVIEVLQNFFKRPTTEMLVDEQTVKMHWFTRPVVIKGST